MTTYEKIQKNELRNENENVKIDVSISSYDDNKSLILGNINGLHIANHNENGKDSYVMDLAVFGIKSVKDIKVTSKTKTIKGTKHRKFFFKLDNGKHVEFTFFEVHE